MLFWLANPNAAMFIQEGDYVVIKKDTNMKVFHVTPNRYFCHIQCSYLFL